MSNNQKYAVVTGGLRGIGRAIVQQLFKQNIYVYIFDIEEQPSDAMTKQEGIAYFCVDIGNPESIASGFDNIYAHQKSLGLEKLRLDILVNNAGITRDSLVLRMSLEQWDHVMNVNVRGAFLCAQHALKVMIRQPKSYIINISSVVGLRGNAGQANYAASKAGIIALTQSLAREYASRNILVNAIAPGIIQTAMTSEISTSRLDMVLERVPLKRVGQPSDIAHLASFLVSGCADYITGQVINVDGGML